MMSNPEKKEEVTTDILSLEKQKDGKVDQKKQS